MIMPGAFEAFIQEYRSYGYDGLKTHDEATK